MNLNRPNNGRERRPYMRPTLTLNSVTTLRMLAYSEQELPFDPGDGTDDALSKKRDMWNNSNESLWKNEDW